MGTCATSQLLLLPAPHVVSVAFCAHPSSLPCSSASRLPVWDSSSSVFSIFSFALCSRRQGYKNCLVLKAFYATLCAQSLRRRRQRRLLRLFVWRVLLPLPHTLSAPHSPSFPSLLFLSVFHTPHPNITHTCVFISSSYSHTLPTRYLFCRRRCRCCCRCFCRRRLCRFAFLLVFYYYYFSRYSVFCSPVSLEKFNFYFFVFFFFFYVFAFCLLRTFVRVCVCVCLTLSIFYDYFFVCCFFLYIFHCAFFLLFVLLAAFNACCVFSRIFNAGVGFSPSLSPLIQLYFCFLCLAHVSRAVYQLNWACVCVLFFALIFYYLFYFKQAHFLLRSNIKSRALRFTFYVAFLFALRRDVVVTHMCRGRPTLRCCNSFIRFHFASTRMCLSVCVFVCAMAAFNLKLRFSLFMCMYLRAFVCVCVCFANAFVRLTFFMTALLLLLLCVDVFIASHFLWLKVVCVVGVALFFCLSFSHSICLHSQLHMRWPRLQPVTVWQAHCDASERCHTQLLGRICVCVLNCCCCCWIIIFAILHSCRCCYCCCC